MTDMKMKKTSFLATILLTFVSSAFAQESGTLSGSATYGFESDFIFRGFHISGDTFTPSAEGRVNAENSTYYAGVRTALPTKKADNRVKMHEYYLGAEFEVMEDFSIDLGLSHFDFIPFTDESVTEGMIGLTWDTLLSPALYVYADSDNETTTYEGSIGHAFPIDQKSAIMVTGYVGNSEFYTGSTYYGAMLDYSYSFTRYARLTFGVRYVSLDPEEADVLELAIDSDNVTSWGVSFTAGF